MTEKLETTRTIHAGRNVKRLREMLGIKQEALAMALGSEWSQQRVSLLEKRKQIDIDLLERIADVLGLPIEAIINVNDKCLVNIITDNLTDNRERNTEPLSFNIGQKWLEALEENRKLTRKLLKAKNRIIKCLKKRISSSSRE